MRNIYTILLLMLLASSIALSPLMSTVKIGYAQGLPMIYVDPSSIIFYSNETYIGQRFNVTIKLQSANDTLEGAQVKMFFDPTVINVTRWIEPKTDPAYIFNGLTTSALPTPPDPGYAPVGPNNASVIVTVLLFPPYPSQAYGKGNGTICIFEFEVKQLPPESGTLTSTLSLDAPETYVIMSGNFLGDDPGEAEKISGSYTAIWVPAPPAGPHVWLETSPSSYQTTKPRPFNVTVLIQNVSATDALIGVQLAVNYNSTFLQATKIIPGNFMNNSLWAPFATFQVYDIETGRALYGEMILPNNTGGWNPPFPQGNGTLVTITFMPLLHEAVSFDIEIKPIFDEFFLDVNGNYIPYLSPKNCSYTYSPLAKPTLGVNPSRYIASHVGETFTLDMTLTDLAPEWEFVYVDFTLRYNSSFLAVLSVNEGSFLSGFGNTTFAYELGDGFIKANITLVPTSVFPSGSGTLVTLQFNATSRPPATSALTLSDTSLLDPNGFVVVHDLSHGFYTMNEVLVHAITVDTTTFYVVTVANVSISPVPMIFNHDHNMVYFNATGWGTPGFIDVTIPRAFMYGDTSWLVIIDGQQVTPAVTDLNATHTLVSLTFNFTTNEPVYIFGIWSIVPEFSASLLPAVLALTAMVSTVIAGVAYRKRKVLASSK